jgi:hypothetical protein
MAQDEICDVQVVGRTTDDQGRTLVQETFWYKGSFYMTDRYERADESSEKKAVEDTAPAPPNPTEDEPVGATSAVEVPTSLVETSLAGCNIVETATTAQPTTTQEAGTAPSANHNCEQVAEQAKCPDESKTKGNRRNSPAPSSGGTDSAKGSGGKKSPAARPVSPKGGQRRPPRGGTRQEHGPRTRRPSCRHAGMCRSPRSCYEAYLHTTEFGQLLDPADIASFCYICARCSTCCGYESGSASLPVKDVPSIRPDRAPDESFSPAAVPEEAPHARQDRAPDPPANDSGEVLEEPEL